MAVGRYGVVLDSSCLPKESWRHLNLFSCRIEYIVMTENTGQRTVRVTNPDGLHLRTCEAVARVASAFRAEATVSRGEKRANAESVLDLMALGAEEGTELHLEASGPDSVGLLDALAKVI